MLSDGHPQAQDFIPKVTVYGAEADSEATELSTPARATISETIFG